MRNDLSSSDLPLYIHEPRRNRVHEVERKRPNSADFTKTDISVLVKAKHVEKYEMRTRICTILDILKFWTLFSSREGD